MKDRKRDEKGYIQNRHQPLVLTVDRQVAGGQDAVTPLDVGLMQVEHRLA